MKKKLYTSDIDLWNKIKNTIEPLNPKKYQNKKHDDQLAMGQENKLEKNDIGLEKGITEKKKKLAQNIETTSQKITHEEKNIFTGINRKLDQRMSRGHVIIDDTLDLHGYTQEEVNFATWTEVSPTHVPPNPNTPAPQPHPFPYLTSPMSDMLDPASTPSPLARKS